MNMKHGEQAQLARRIGITPKHLSDVMCGREVPSRKLAEILERELGVKAEAWIWPNRHGNPYIKGTKKR